MLRTSVMATHTEARHRPGPGRVRPGAGCPLRAGRSLVQAPHLRPAGRRAPAICSLMRWLVASVHEASAVRMPPARQAVDDLPVEERAEGQVLVVGTDAEGPHPGVVSFCGR